MDDMISAVLDNFQNPFGSVEDETTRLRICRKFPELRAIQRSSEIGNLLLGYRSWVVLIQAATMGICGPEFDLTRAVRDYR